MRLFPTPPYRNEPELLDETSVVGERDLSTTLRDIRRANIFGLGTWVVKHHLAKLLVGWEGTRPLRVLDIATGSGDIPEELCRWAGKRGIGIEVTLTDISPQILEVARQRMIKAGFGDQASYMLCDAACMPFEDGEFDIVVCSLAFHHLDLGQAHRALLEMARLARIGFIINDVYRAQGAWYMAWVLVHLTTGNYLTRHDGPASVLRAYTPRELRHISRNTGVPVEITTHPFWRVAVVGTTGTPAQT